MEYLYRFCVQEELIFLLENNWVVSKEHTFLSFTSNNNKFPILGNIGTESNYLVTYDKNKIINQKGIEIIYDVNWFFNNLKIFNHVNSSCEISFQDFCDDEYSYIPKNLDINEKIKLYIKENINHLKSEKETIIKKLNFESGLLINIERLDNKNFEPELQKILIKKYLEKQ